MKFSDREFCTVLAALRHYHQSDTDEWIDAIAAEHGPPLSGEEIEELCERINVKDNDDSRHPLRLGTMRAERHSLAIDVFQATLNATSTFDEVGPELAYLLGAILLGQVSEYDAEESALQPVLKACFPDESHPVWQHFEQAEA